MSALYNNLPEIPIPSFAHVNNNDDRVYVRLPSPTGRVRDAKTRSIGTKMSSGNMCPNKNFGKLYPELWEKYYPNLRNFALFPPMKRIGLYAMILAISQDNGLYDCLRKSYSLSTANVLMDYAMACLQEQSNDIAKLTTSIKESITFSLHHFSGNALSKFFKEWMNKHPVICRDLNADFHKMWLQNCTKNGSTECWISIDGSISNCYAQQPEGDKKTAKNDNVISYIYAVDAKTGIPLTYSLYQGSKLDAQAFHGMITKLRVRNIKIAGVILDRECCTKEVVQVIEELKYNYIIVLKSDTYGHQQMLTNNSNKIRCKTAYFINNEGIFAIQEQAKIFKDDDHPVSIHLYYDLIASAHGIQALTERVGQYQEETTEKIANGATYRDIKVPEDLKDIFSINTLFRRPKLKIHHIALDQLLNNQGFYSIACSDATLTSNQVYQIVKKFFRGVNTQKESYEFKTYGTESIVNQFAATFITSIIKAYLDNIAQQLNITTNQLITEALLVRALLDDTTDKYQLEQNDSDELQSAFTMVGLTADCFTDIIKELNGMRRRLYQTEKRTIKTVKFLEQKQKKAEEKKQRQAQAQKVVEAFQNKVLERLKEEQ